MWACKVASSLFYPKIPNVPGLCWTCPVFLCIYLGVFSTFLLAGPEQGFSLCQMDPSSPSSDRSLLARHSVVGATALWQHHLRPCAHLAMPPPSSQPWCHLHPLLPVLPHHGDGQLLWICSGLGLAGSTGAHVPAQRGTGEQMNFGSSGCGAREPWGAPTSHTVSQDPCWDARDI